MAGLCRGDEAVEKPVSSPTEDVPLEKVGSFITGCYFTNWAQYRPDKGKYTPTQYQIGLCDYIFYAFAKLNEDFTVDQFEWNDISSLYPAIMEYKKGSNLKVLLSLGGWNAGTSIFKRMADTSQSRQKFIDSLTKFLRIHKFDGFDLDWEYPDDAKDKMNYALLCNEIVAKFEAEAKTAGVPRMLFTAAVSVDHKKVDIGYDVPQLAKVFDFINLMAYDFHGAWEQSTGLNAPLFRRKTDPVQFQMWNVADAAKYWAEKGMPKKKIIIGLATYGRGWTLKDTNNLAIGAPGGGPSKSTKYLREAGVASYYELCQMLSDGAKRFWDEESKTPYLVHKDQWFGYDDIESLTAKIKWLMSEGYGGAFVWTLDYDDFDGTFCKQHAGKRYPLVSLMQNLLGSSTVAPPTQTTSTHPPTTSRPPAGSTTAVPPPTTVTTAKPSGIFKCPSDGYFSDPASCSSYYQCVGGTAHKMHCAPGTLFNPKSKVCDHAANVECKV